MGSYLWRLPSWIASLSTPDAQARSGLRCTPAESSSEPARRGTKAGREASLRKRIPPRREHHPRTRIALGLAAAGRGAMLALLVPRAFFPGCRAGGAALPGSGKEPALLAPEPRTVPWRVAQFGAPRGTGTGCGKVAFRRRRDLGLETRQRKCGRQRRLSHALLLLVVVFIVCTGRGLNGWITGKHVAARVE